MWRDLTQIMQLLLGTEKKCDKVEVRYHLNIQQRVQEQTGKINLARVTLSDLENDSDDNETSVSYFCSFFITFCYQPFCPFPNFSCIHLFHFRHSVKFIHYKKTMQWRQSSNRISVRKNERYNITRENWMNKLDFYARAHKKYVSLVVL